MNAETALTMIHASLVLDKLMLKDPDAVDVDGVGFCRHFTFSENEYDGVVGRLEDESSTLREDEVYDLLETTVLEISFIDDNFEKRDFCFSLKELMEGTIKEDGSIEIKWDAERGCGKYAENTTLLNFYRLVKI